MGRLGAVVVVALAVVAGNAAQRAQPTGLPSRRPEVTFSVRPGCTSVDRGSLALSLFKSGLVAQVWKTGAASYGVYNRDRGDLMQIEVLRTRLAHERCAVFVTGVTQYFVRSQR